jgi:hypothetical protein
MELFCEFSLHEKDTFPLSGIITFEPWSGWVRETGTGALVTDSNPPT